ncbi:hypothetical protein GFS60_00446 [Rhodococcus sp. WAY2]|nr:hypothetical protein GFS60_00446 [Rhodococcus sp. WAY2]
MSGCCHGDGSTSDSCGHRQYQCGGTYCHRTLLEALRQPRSGKTHGYCSLSSSADSAKGRFRRIPSGNRRPAGPDRLRIGSGPLPSHTALGGLYVTQSSLTNARGAFAGALSRPPSPMTHHRRTS